MFTATVTAAKRLDLFLVTEAGITRGEAQRRIAEGLVTVNDAVVTKSSHTVKPGDAVAVTGERAPAASRISSVDLALPVLYEDETCLVINKPKGFAVHPGAGMSAESATILHGVAHLFHKRGIPFSESSALVHRLDKETTGCLLIAKSQPAQAALQKQFGDRTVGKTYLAIVAGIPKPAAAVIDAPIGRHSGDRTRMTVFHSVQHRREAKTTYRTISVALALDAALLACDLHTGRTHQVRVHLKTIGYPILGDNAYGTKESRSAARKYGTEGLKLHAWKLSFQSSAGKRHSVVAPPPQEFQESLQRLGIEWNEEVP